MESWRKVWREGIAPLLPDRSLKALHDALLHDDATLIQGATTSPPPIQCVQDWPIEAACGITFAGWKGEGLNTVAEAEEFFARICFNVDQLLGEPAACRWFLNWFDETPRHEMRVLLMEEVSLTIEGRSSVKQQQQAQQKEAAQTC